MVYALAHLLLKVALLIGGISFVLVLQPVLLPFWGRSPDDRIILVLAFSGLSFAAARIAVNALYAKWILSMGERLEVNYAPKPLVLFLALFIYLLWCSTYQTALFSIDLTTYALYFSIFITVISIAVAFFTVNSTFRQQEKMKCSTEEY